MQATTSKTFIEMLEDEIRVDLRKEIEAEVLSRFGRLDPDSTSEKAPSAAASAAGRLETWLASNMGRTTFARPQAAARSYNVKAANASRPQNASAHEKARSNASTGASTIQLNPALSTPGEFSVPTATAVTAEQLIAVELLSRHSGKTLASTFSEDDLKHVWRKAALKSHPDRFAGEDQMKQVRMAVLFRELCEAYEHLSALLDTAKSKAA